MFKSLWGILICTLSLQSMAKTAPNACEVLMKLTEDSGIETTQTFHLWKGASAYSEFPIMGQVISVTTMGDAECPKPEQMIREKLSVLPEHKFFKEHQQIKIRIEYVQHFFRQPSKQVTLLEVLEDQTSLSP